MRKDRTIAVIIPMLNEEETIGMVLNAIPDWVDFSIVCDNGSIDTSAAKATAAGARVVHESRRGYGAACLRAIKELQELDAAQPTIVVFLDGDFSDNPAQMDQLVDPIIEGDAHFVLGSRVLGPCEDGALTTTQRFGNWLSCYLLELLFNTKYTDLGPFRAILLDKLTAMEMDDQDFGWTVQMQARAARLGLQILEVPVNYRNRAGGNSKVSGTISGVFGAGTTILRVIFAEAFFPPAKFASTKSHIFFIQQKVRQWFQN